MQGRLFVSLLCVKASIVTSNFLAFGVAQTCPRTMATLMKAMRVHKFGGPEVIQMDSNLPIPKPGPGKVVVKVHACGINPVDTYVRAGAYGVLPSLPYSPGRDVAGEVHAVGAGVDKVQIGQRVFGSGGCAQYVECDASSVYALPDHLSYSEGASVGTPYFTAYKAMSLGDVKPGQRLLVHGASGGVGLAAVQIAKHIGARVTGTAGTEQGADAVRSSGAEKVENHREPHYEAKLLQATDNQGFDVILEMLANVNLGRDLELVTPRGKIVIIGNRGEITINPRVIMQKECIVTGMQLAKTTPDEMLQITKGVAEGLRGGWLIPQVYKEYKMEDLGQAHIDILGTSGAKGNIVAIVPH